MLLSKESVGTLVYWVAERNGLFQTTYASGVFVGYIDPFHGSPMIALVECNGTCCMVPLAQLYRV